LKNKLILSYFISIILSFNLFSVNSFNLFKELLKPKYLKTGDTVAIVAPSGVLAKNQNYILKAKKLLKSWGLEVVIGENVFKRFGHFAGNDKDRASDFQKALDDKSIKAIWCARGGYGAMRIIDDLNYNKYILNPKWIIGYSDITAIHNDLHIIGSESIHAIMCNSLNNGEIEKNKSVSLLKSVLFGEKIEYNISGNKYNKVGNSEGQIVGGNLTLLHSLIGSKSSIDTDKKIIFIEDLGEYHYHIDRMLKTLKRAGYFNNCAGIIVGDFINFRKNSTPFGQNIYEIILETVKEYDFPVVFDFPAGHGEKNYPIILGRKIKLDVTKKQASIIFSN